MHGEKTKQKAILLRKRGLSYKLISTQLDVPKSTLSNWISKKLGKFSRSKQLRHLAKIRHLAAEARTRQRLEKLESIEVIVASNFKNFIINDKRIAKTILASLYWAEGAKHKGVSGLKFANTDPELVSLYIKLLRYCYNLNEERFRVKLHVHSYHKQRNCEKFWSKILNIPLNNFNQTYLKERNPKRKFRENFKGICFLSYLDSNIRLELLEIGKNISSFVK